jgi:hypothetical protein
MTTPNEGIKISTISATPNEGTLKLFKSLLDKMSCFNFFSVMKAVFDEFIFSIHILDNIFLIQSLYARNIYIHWKETDMRSLLGDVCMSIAGEQCFVKNGHIVVDTPDKFSAYKDIKVYPIPPIITKKDIDILYKYKLESFINYEFKDAETALKYLINGLNNIDLEYAKTILDSIDEKAMANKKNSNQTVPDPIRLTYYSEWADVKSFVDCGDVHLGKVKDDAVRINCNIKRSMMDEHKMRAITVGIEVAPNDEKNNPLVANGISAVNSDNVSNPQYEPDISALFTAIKENEIFENNYIRAVIRDLKIKEILDITIKEKAGII